MNEWTSEEKRFLQETLNILKTALGENFKENANSSLNIFNEYNVFLNTIHHHQDKTTNYNNIMKIGYTILSVFYLQNIGSNNAYEKSFENFRVEQQITAELADMLQDLENFVKPENDKIIRRETKNGRRWQVHPINQSRSQKGFYDNLVQECKGYRR